MDAFEYLSVLISIVLGLGIAQLLLGFARWLEQRSRFEPFGPSIAWAAFLLLVHVQAWWAMYGLVEYQGWTFLGFSMVLLQPLVLFLLAVVVFPGPTAPERDLRDNFHEQRPWFFGLLIALLVVSLAKNVVLDGSLPEPVNLGFHLLTMALSVVGLVATSDCVHRILAYGSLALFVGYIGVLFSEL